MMHIRFQVFHLLLFGGASQSVPQLKPDHVAPRRRAFTQQQSDAGFDRGIAVAPQRVDPAGCINQHHVSRSRAGRRGSSCP